jgi:hypothetical protein
MTTLWLLSVAAAIEAITGIALIVSPQIVSQLLLGADLPGTGIAVARVAGAALLALGVGCWKSREDAGNAPPLLAAMLTYNVLVTAYLIYLGVGGELVGKLLWPAVALHAALALLFVRACMSNQTTKSRPNIG